MQAWGWVKEMYLCTSCWRATQWANHAHLFLRMMSLPAHTSACAQVTVSACKVIHICCVQAWGWVLEMYGFTLACHIVGIPRVDLFLRMMSQPPWDTQLGPYYLLHYTCVCLADACASTALPSAQLAGSHRRTMSQPPWDTQLGPYYLLHYTCARFADARAGTALQSQQLAGNNRRKMRLLLRDPRLGWYYLLRYTRL